MKHLLLFENYNQQQYKTAEEMCEYITEITPYEDDVPDYFLKMIMNSNAKFELKKVKIKDVISNDVDVKEYIKSNSKSSDEDEDYGADEDEDYGADEDEDYGDYAPGDRYANANPDEGYVPNAKEIDIPIVILNNIVLDGYNRLLVKSYNDETEIDAWVSI